LKLKNVLVTGVSGFVGAALYKSLCSNKSFDVTGVVRPSSFSEIPSKFKYINDIGPLSNWKDLLVDIDIVVHLAGKAHAINEHDNTNADEYIRVNTEGTINLARQAAASGVTRFIFISSIKVNGDRTSNNKAFSSKSITRPFGSYATSKNKAEIALKDISKETGMEFTIIRPALVYGPGVKGNIQSLIHLLNIGVPMPFASINANSRSLIGIDNLVELLTLTLHHSGAANQTFLASDGNDISTYELIKILRDASQSRSVIFPAPLFLLKFLGKLFRVEERLNKLLDSIEVDISNTQAILNWTPSRSCDEGLIDMVQYEQLKKNHL
jgi:nucleoside-diphosphate-sugar epimerase